MARSAGVARKDVDRAVERAVFARSKAVAASLATAMAGEPRARSRRDSAFWKAAPAAAATPVLVPSVSRGMQSASLGDAGMLLWNGRELTAGDAIEAGFGSIETARGCLPLTALEIDAHIEGLAAETTIRQQFRNVFAEPLEATYRFPLVVAPRYCPGTALDGDPVGDGILADTDLVPDASRISPLVAIDPRQPDRAIAPKSLRRIVQPVERAWPASQSCAAPDVHRTMCSISPPPPPSMDDLARYFSAEEDDPGTTGFLDAARVEARRILVKARPWWGSIGWLTARKVGNLLTAVRQLLDSPAVARAPRQSIQALTIAYARLHAMPADRNAIVALLDALADIALLPETADRWWRTSAVGRNPRGEVPAEHRRRS